MEAPSIIQASQDLLEIRTDTAYKAVGSFWRVVSDTTASGERHVNRAPIATFGQNAFIPHVLSHYSVAHQLAQWRVQRGLEHGQYSVRICDSL
jgi:hypothetical protein